jgi:hypothetical protein
MTGTPRPMTLGEILDQTFQIYRSYFFLLLGLAVLPLTVQMALFLIGFPFDGLVRQTTLTVTLQGKLVDTYHWIATDFSSYFLNFVMWPVFCGLAAHIALGQQWELRDTLNACRLRWRSLLAIACVFWLLEIALPGWIHGARPLWRAWLTAPFWLRFIMSPIEGFALVAPLLLSFPIWTIERRTVTESIARSWTLSKGAYGRMFLTFLLQSVAIWSIGLTIRFILSIAFGFIFREHISSLMRSSWIFVPNYVAAVFSAPLFPIAITLIYYDQRIRLEGFDIEWMMDLAGMSAPASDLVLTAEIASPAGEEMRG